MLLDDIWRTINVILLGIVFFAILIDPVALIGVCIFNILLGFICRFIAIPNGKDGNWAFVYGFLWGIIAIVYYIVSGKNK